MSFKHKHRIIRALFARFLCLLHIGLSIFVLYHVKNKQLIYLIPIIGAILLVLETFLIAICFKCKEPITWLSPIFFIYVTTIVSSIWFLELDNVSKIRAGYMVRDYNIYNKVSSDIVASIKVIWSQMEVQMFFAILIFVRWIIPKSHLSPHGLSDLLFKYFAISCDMLDFLSIIQDAKLITYDSLVYSTLAIWTWSTFQFFIYVPTYEDEEKREFHAYISNSLLNVMFLDLPYLCIRIIVIFAFGSHNYNSYFFTTKNTVMILLQIFRIKATCEERTIRTNKHAKNLKDKIGFDKEEQRLYNRELDSIAIKNFEKTKMASSTPLNSPRQNFNEINYNNINNTPLNSPRQKFSEISYSTPSLSQPRQNLGISINQKHSDV